MKRIEDMAAPEVRALLQRAVDEKGADYVYPDSEKMDERYCQYFVDGRPSCIFGHIFAYAGLTGDTKPVGELVGIQTIRGWSERLLGAASAAQHMQDTGGTWGEALAAFDAALAEQS